MAKSTQILETIANLTVEKVAYIDKQSKEEKSFNAYYIEVDGKKFEISLKPADKKLFEYIIGI